MTILLRNLAECLFLAYSISFLLYHRKSFSVRPGYWIYFSIALLIHFSFSAGWGLALSSHYGALAFLGIIILELKCMYKMNMMQLLFEGSYFVASLYWARGIVLPSFALCLGQSVQWVRHDESCYRLAWVISLCIMLLYHELFRRVIAPQQKMEKLYRSHEQLRFVAIFQTMLLGYMLFINLGRYYGLDLPWYKLTYIVSCVICFFTQGFLVKHGIRISILIEAEMHKQLLQKQLSRQLQHYNAYQKYTESFRAFKHDYKNMMTSVKSLLSAGEYSKAERMLDTIHDTMQKQVLVHKTYSNHIILDTVLQDAANMCEEHSIRFSAMAYIPVVLEIADIDIVRIFSNLTDNAIEACAKVASESERFLSVTSSVNKENGWLTVEMSNSFHGEANMRNGMPKSTKENQEIHGIGLSVVSDTVESLGGLMKIDVNHQEKIFTIKLLFPISL
ncbi:sensor histidine kinase [Desulforamulus aeronauticus]|uniref:GHKL domain-containing protein n=1 Tax=Desulforamulus aeronauticus DSM 10349 TaxID=1121421 RepID=A0A1M6VTR4_9FIRM|nr:GHKL domain-containing protein [Desulforamulus aeronauticus]SHK84791.1 GHKL domain-containing protein [Desulforamulus aeronauticus DSM 10349]